MSADITLKVIEARPTDVRGIARIDPAVFSEMGWQAGDVVMCIEGKKKTAALLWPGYPEDTKTGVVRLDANTRRNAGVSIDDKVPVSFDPGCAGRVGGLCPHRSPAHNRSGSIPPEVHGRPGHNQGRHHRDLGHGQKDRADGDEGLAFS